MRCLIAIVFAVVAGSTAACNAQCGGGGYGYGYGIGALYQSLEYNVPYFAAHPPVYYSQPVPRTYGYSPFAYPPNVMTPEVVEPITALEIANPFVPSSVEQPAEPSDQTVEHAPAQPEPLVISNPFATAGSTVVSSGR
ncbi:hypothetical protein Pla175_20640 [Pirellulimonas nuda]|uniref:Uncharacterized protein n=1 Tax=Pirellulimonas nuda TaxID=2528009 RepID=A0A518DB63_9BACT|nr:hypothetical protein [Pirellulimonas nuda]QDU88683.1 hypothetical protein Pla175_20640 [Pirellulimonas nuda]